MCMICNMRNCEPGAGALWHALRNRFYEVDSMGKRLLACGADGLGEWHVPDKAAETLNPDKAVCDVDGPMWLAPMGAGRVACNAPDGSVIRTVSLDAPQTPRPAIGGSDFSTLFCATALQDKSAADRIFHPYAGSTLATKGIARGIPEPMVIL